MGVSSFEAYALELFSALNESERRYRLITEAMPQFVWLDAPDGSGLYANERWLEYTGLTAEQNQGFGWESVVHPDDLRRLESRRNETLRTGEIFEGECRYRGSDGKYRWFLFRSIPVRDDDGRITSWLGTATDIDKQKRAEAQHAFFARASDLLASTLDVEGTLERMVRLAIPSLGTWCQVDLLDLDGHLRVATIAHAEPTKELRLRELVGQRIYDKESSFGPPAVARTCKPQMLQRIDEDAVRAVIPEEFHRAIYRGAGYAAGVMVPLRIRGRVLGVLGIASDDPTRLYTDFDVSTALELARRGAGALENAQSFEREHRVATTLQRALLPPSLPAGETVRFYAAYAPAAWAQGEAIGGDWYDAFPLDERRIAISMGDVAGHGIDAAVAMGSVRQAVRAAAICGGSPREVLSRANIMLGLEQRAVMTTALFGIYDTQSRELKIANAGHPSPLHVDANGSAIAICTAGPPLGSAFDAADLPEQSFALDAGDVVIFYTDGLIEYDRDLIRGAQRLEDAARDRRFLLRAEPAQAIIDAVLDGPQRDDVAVLIMATSA
jgi:PAS domain S-box-containing protein